MAVQSRRATEDDLRATPKDGQRYELVDGEIHATPGGVRHSRVCVRLVVALETFASEHALGQVLGFGTGLRFPGGNVRSPDLTFTAAARLGTTPLSDDFAEVIPDLAVEVLARGESALYVLESVVEYLEAGVRLVWVIDPAKSKAIVYRSLGDVTEIGAYGELDGGTVLPGFRCRLADVL